MANYYIIAAGGTGAICASSFIYMAAAGCTDRNAVYHVLLMDKDEESDAMTTCINLLENYKALRTQIGEQAQTLILPKIVLYHWNFTEEIRDEYCRQNGVMKGGLEKLTLKKLFNPREDPKIAVMLESMYTPEELDIDLNKGFYGHPNIGAPVFDYVRDRFLASDIPQADGTTRQNEFMISLRQSLSAGLAYVYLFGSLFGGTGATVIPNVVQALRKLRAGADKYGETKLVLGGSVIMPYFRIPDCAGDDIEKLQKIVPMDSKFAKQTSEALDYYHESNLLSNMMNLMLVGCSTLDVTCEHFASGGAQCQHFHMVHMLAAISACRFFRNKLGSMSENMAAPVTPAGELLLWKVAPEDPKGAGVYHSVTPSELGINDEYERIKAMLRFSVVVAYYMRLKFDKAPMDLRHDMEILGTYKQIQINGRNLTKEKELDEDIISRFYQEPVQNAGAFCRSFIRYLLDISLSGYDWGMYRSKIRVEDKAVEVGGKTFYPYILGPVNDPVPGAFNGRWVDMANLTQLKDLVETGNPDHIVDNKSLNDILSYPLLDDERTAVTERNYPNSIATIYEAQTMQHLGLYRGGLFNHIVNDGRQFFEIYDELYKQCGGTI